MYRFISLHYNIFSSSDVDRPRLLDLLECQWLLMLFLELKYLFQHLSLLCYSLLWEIVQHHHNHLHPYPHLHHYHIRYGVRYILITEFPPRLVQYQLLRGDFYDKIEKHLLEQTLLLSSCYYI